MYTAIFLFTLSLAGCTYSSILEADTTCTNASEFYRCPNDLLVLEKALYKMEGNKLNLSDTFYPPRTIATAFVNVTYKFQDIHGEVTGDCNVTFWWTSGGFLLMQSPSIFRFSSLFFGNKVDKLNNLELTLPYECRPIVTDKDENCVCTGRDNKMLDVLTQQLKVYAKYNDPSLVTQDDSATAFALCDQEIEDRYYSTDLKNLKGFFFFLAAIIMPCIFIFLNTAMIKSGSTVLHNYLSKSDYHPDLAALTIISFFITIYVIGLDIASGVYAYKRWDEIGRTHAITRSINLIITIVLSVYDVLVLIVHGILFCYLTFNPAGKDIGCCLSCFKFCFGFIFYAIMDESNKYTLIWLETKKDSNNRYLWVLVLCILASTFSIAGHFMFILMAWLTDSEQTTSIAIAYIGILTFFHVKVRECYMINRDQDLKACCENTECPDCCLICYPCKQCIRAVPVCVTICCSEDQKSWIRKSMEIVCVSFIFIVISASLIVVPVVCMKLDNCSINYYWFTVPIFILIVFTIISVLIIVRCIIKKWDMLTCCQTVHKNKLIINNSSCGIIKTQNEKNLLYLCCCESQKSGESESKNYNDDEECIHIEMSEVAESEVAESEVAGIAFQKEVIKRDDDCYTNEGEIFFNSKAFFAAFGWSWFVMFAIAITVTIFWEHPISTINLPNYLFNIFQIFMIIISAMITYKLFFSDYSGINTFIKKLRQSYNSSKTGTHTDPERGHVDDASIMGKKEYDDTEAVAELVGQMMNSLESYLHKAIQEGKKPPETQKAVTSDGIVPAVTSGGPLPAVPSGGPLPAVTSGGPITIVASGGAVPVVASGGPITVVASGGPITFVASGGPVPAVTSGGPITAVTSGVPITVVTSGGPITFVASGGSVPAVTSGRPVPADTSGRSIPSVASSGPVPAVTTGGFVPTVTLGGSVPSVTSGRPVPAVTLSGPVPALTSDGNVPAVTLSGLIPAVTSSGFVPAVTSGGFVSAVTSSGSVPAVTSGGSVPAVTSGGSVSAVTSGGPVPAGTSGGSVPAVMSGGLVPAVTSGGSIPAVISGKSAEHIFEGCSTDTCDSSEVFLKPTHVELTETYNSLEEILGPTRKVHGVKGDGKCLFTSLSHLLRHHTKDNTVREAIIHYEKQNKTILEQKLKENNLDDHIQNLETNDKEWGDHIDIFVAAIIYKVDIFVATSAYDNGKFRWMKYSPSIILDAPEGNIDRPPYNKYRWIELAHKSEHYDPVTHTENCGPPAVFTDAALEFRNIP